MGTGDLIVVALVVGVGACVQFLTGFGFSLTAVPLLALAIDVRTASMLAAVLAMFTSTAQAWLGRELIDWSAVKRIAGVKPVRIHEPICCSMKSITARF